ncbi:MAG TPA: hypothetical protein VG649_13830 [Candidatus Angelobacter sp.]|nr:hypothetical protein [Candidatus Angelobacter sp.]
MNQGESFSGRVFYRAGGGVRLALFVVWLLPAIAVAALLALLLFWLFLNGYYYLVIVPVAASLAPAALVRVAVIKGHCRNWLIGGLAGLCVAVVLYLGYFYCGMVHHWGPRAISRPDLLPAYIKARMKTDVIHDVNRSKESATHSAVMNWLMLGLEASGVFFIVIFPSIQRSRRPYCEACGRWMKRSVTSFSPKASAVVMDALRSGSSQALVALCATPVYSSVPNLTVGIDLCPSLQEGAWRGCPVYISVKQIIQWQGIGGADPIDQARGKLLLRALQATSTEIAALAPRFKLLDNITGRSAIAGPLQTKAANLVQEDLSVEIRDVESEYAGKVRTRGMIWAGSVLTFAPLLTFFGGLGLLLWATGILDGKVSPIEKFTAFGMIAVAIVCIVGGMGVALLNPTYIANRILQQRLRHELARRPKRIVNPDNPESLFAEIVPKANWGRLMLDSASDVGLLLLDQGKREILFEGDRERLRIPVDALTYCGFEEFVYKSGHATIRYHYVVLRIESPTRFWEAPIRLRTGTGLGARKRKKEMMAVFESIQRMRPGPSAAMTI